MVDTLYCSILRVHFSGPITTRSSPPLFIRLIPSYQTHYITNNTTIYKILKNIYIESNTSILIENLTKVQKNLIKFQPKFQPTLTNPTHITFYQSNTQINHFYQYNNIQLNHIKAPIIQKYTPNTTKRKIKNSLEKKFKKRAKQI